MRGLSLQALRDANRARLPTFKNKHGEPAHSPDGSDWSPAQWLQAVIGELGELANMRKKYERGDVSHAEFVACAAKELADVLTYLDLLAMRICDTRNGIAQKGINLSDATIEKFNEVSARVRSPIWLRYDGFIRLWEGAPPTFDPAKMPARDEEGYAFHPELPAIDEDESMEHALAAMGYEYELEAFEFDDPTYSLSIEAFDAASDAAFKEWKPTPIPGHQLVAIYDTEDGRYAMSIRKIEVGATS